VVASTARDLATMVGHGLFREDLRAMLSETVLRIPPLRERPGDVLPLAERFRSAAVASCLPADQEPPAFGPAAVAALAAHRWPGNLVELENAVRRAVIVAEGAVINPHHLGLEFSTPPSEAGESAEDYNAAKQRAVEAFQNEFVRRALEKTGGNVSQAAERCGLTRTALQRIMRRIGLSRGGD
jgi:DNA-binding NtrC family response regulator